MDITLDKINKTEAVIKISLKEADYVSALNQKIRDYSKKANIKGFRPGKVPEGMIRKMYGKALLVDEINHMLSHKLTDYIRASDLQLLGEPLPNREKAEKVDWDTQKDFEFEYSIGFANEFELPIDKKLKIERYTIKIDDQVLNETIENLQRQFGEPEIANEVQEKDFVYGALKSADGAIDKEIKIDTKELDKSAFKRFRGAKKGDQVNVDPKEFYKNPHQLKYQLGLTDEEFKKLKGKLTFTIKGIERSNELPVNQEFFDRTFGPGTVDSLEAFRAKVKDEVSKSYVREEEQYFHYKLRELLLEKAKIELPKEFLKRWLKETNEEMADDILNKEFDAYSRELQWSLIKNKIVKTQDLKIGYEGVIEETKQMIRNQFGMSGIVDGIEEQLESFANNYLQGENGDNFRKVHNQVQHRRVMDFITSEITIKDKEISLDAFRKLD